MKNIKTLTLGIIIGAVATLSITALAEYITTPNPYPVKVNGQEVRVEGYNINGSTYFKLRDVADAVGGFSVDFADNTIIVNTNGGEGVPTPTSVPTSTDTPGAEPVANVTATPNPKLGLEEIDMKYLTNGFTSDGLPIRVLEDGNKYISLSDAEKVYNYEDYGYQCFGGKLYANNSIRDEDIILYDIPIAESHASYVLADYYENDIRAIFQNNCQ